MGTSTKTIRYEYDAAGNRSLLIDPDGGRTTYAYDSLNRISSLINPQLERTSYTYDANGRQTLKKLANGSRASFMYDAASQLTTLANLKSNNSIISEFNYQYDNVGNRVVSVEADNSRVSWSYDNAYQLTKEHRTGTSAYENLFSYDAAGNRLVKNEDGARTTSTYDTANQLQTSLDAAGTTTYSYDADGNQRLVQTPSGNRTTTIWNYENKNTIVELPTGIRNTMSYEPDGLRTTLEESTGTRKFIWDHESYLAEADSNNDIQVIFTNAPAQYGNLISQRRGNTTSYYHYEALGSTRELSDSIEAVTDTYLYDAWGNQITSTGTTVNPFRWTGNIGYYWNEEAENYYIRARIYQPTIGRWLSTDPLGFVDGLNLYMYARNNIVNILDPSGLFCIVCRWRRYGDGESFLSLDENFADGFEPVQSEAYAVQRLWENSQQGLLPFNQVFGPALASTAADLYEQVSIVGGAQLRLPIAGDFRILRHPIIVFADVCFDNFNDCVVTGAEQRQDINYDFANNRWVSGPWGQWTGKFQKLPTPVDQDPQDFKLVRIGELERPPVQCCTSRIIIYDETVFDARFSNPRRKVSRKNVRRKITISDGTNSYSLSDKFTLGWRGSVQSGFTSTWEYTPGVSNADPNPSCD